MMFVFVCSLDDLFYPFMLIIICILVFLHPVRIFYPCIHGFYCCICVMYVCLSSVKVFLSCCIIWLDGMHFHVIF
uniref:Uncharacterized protein n=1 Tax=Ixodes ricinus TaxID=34613 RepID=A0A6B0U3F3_IXORI